MKCYITILIYSVSLCLVSCYSSLDEIGIREIGNDQTLFGFKNSKYIIGKTNRQDILAIEYYDSLGLQIEIVHGLLNSVTITSSTHFELQNGLRVGSTLEDVIQIMGEPINDEISINKGDIQIGTLPVNLYKNGAFIIDDSNVVNLIAIGENKK